MGGSIESPIILTDVRGEHNSCILNEINFVSSTLNRHGGGVFFITLSFECSIIYFINAYRNATFL